MASATNVTGEETQSSIDTMAIMSATEAAIAKATSSSELWGQGMAKNTQKAVANAVAVAVAKTAASVFQQIADSKACKAEQPKVCALGLCSCVSLCSLTKGSHISITVTLSPCCAEIPAMGLSVCPSVLAALSNNCQDIWQRARADKAHIHLRRGKETRTQKHRQRCLQRQRCLTPC